MKSALHKPFFLGGAKIKGQKGLCVRQCSDGQVFHVTAIPDLCINQNRETFTSVGPCAQPTQTENFVTV